MFPELTAEEVDYVIEKVLEWDRTRVPHERQVPVVVVGAGQARHAPRRRVPGERPFRSGGHLRYRRGPPGCGGRQAWACPRNPRTRASLPLALRPDVFCFCTLPNLRAEMVRIGIECGARLIAMEKPVALTSAEGFAIRDLLEASGVKAVVSHQHRYGAHYQKVKEIIAERRAGAHPHGLRNLHRLDDAHALAPDRLHALVQRRSRGGMGDGAGGRPRKTRRLAPFARLHRRLHPLCQRRARRRRVRRRRARCARESITGGANAASARRAARSACRWLPQATGSRC